MGAYYTGLILHDQGIEYRLMDYGNVIREREANGKIDLSFQIVETDRNKEYFDKVQKDSVIELVDEPGKKGQKYRMMKPKRKRKGQATIKECTLRHTFFDIQNDFQYEELSGTINPTVALNHIFDPTPYTWVNLGAFNSVEFENWGADNCLKLFQEFLNRYGGEFVVDSVTKTVTLKVEQGKINDGVLRYNHNIKTITEEIDISNVATYIEGKGKRTEDEEGNLISQVTASYTSPYWMNYKDAEGVPRLRHAGIISDERFTSEQTLTEHLEKSLNDEPDIFITIDALELRKNIFENGKYNTDKIYSFDLYDTVPFIYEPWNYNTEVRILAVKDTPLNPEIAPVYTLSGIKETITDKTANLESTRDIIKQLTDQDGNLSLKIKKLYRSSTMYDDETGSWWIATDDPNAYVHIGAGGMVVKKGLIYVEREDGFASIIGGMFNRSQGVDAADPPFYQDFNIEIIDRHYTTLQTSLVTCNFYTLQRVARYFVMEINLFNEDGSLATAALEMDGVQLATATTTSTTGQNKLLIVDFGVPDASVQSMYLKIKTNHSTARTYCRKIRAWQVDFLE